MSKTGCGEGVLDPPLMFTFSFIIAERPWYIVQCNWQALVIYEWYPRWTKWLEQWNFKLSIRIYKWAYLNEMCGIDQFQQPLFTFGQQNHCIWDFFFVRAVVNISMYKIIMEYVVTLWIYIKLLIWHNAYSLINYWCHISMSAVFCCWSLYQTKWMN